MHPWTALHNLREAVALFKGNFDSNHIINVYKEYYTKQIMPPFPLTRQKFVGYM